MRAPVAKRHTDGIVADIITKAGGHPFLEPLIRRRIKDLQRMLPPFTGNHRDNKERADDLEKWIDEGKKKLTRLPYPLPAILFAPEMFGRLAAEQYTGIGINP